MGINNLAVQTFSSSGSQSVTRANKADSSRQITSEFISRAPVQYIHGSGMSVINGSLKRLPVSNAKTETFSIPNNIDAISDMILNLTLSIGAPSTGGFDCSGIFYSKTFLVDIIDRIEIKMGGLLIQTIYNGDIYIRNYSELGTLTTNENSFKNKINGSYLDTGSIIGYATGSAQEISFSLSIPFIGRCETKDRSFLQTGSFTKNLTVTIIYHECASSAEEANTGLKSIPFLQNGLSSSTRIDTKLCILSHIITDTEKNFMKQNIVNRVMNTSSGMRIEKITRLLIGTGTTDIEIDLDAIDINVTHIGFCLNVDVFNQAESLTSTDPGYPNQTISTAATPLANADNNAGAKRITVGTLKAISGYETSQNRISSSWGEAVNDSISALTSGSSLSIHRPDVLGVFRGWLVSAELILGNETTGEIPQAILASNIEEFSLKDTHKNFYIIKLADKAFSTAGVPFSRIKNKRLVLTVRNNFFTNGIGTYIADTTRDANISVCACGTTLQIISNNAVSFSYI
jgi:hypothetical protein